MADFQSIIDMNKISKFKIFVLRKLFRKDLIIMNCAFRGNVNVGNLNRNQDTFIVDSIFMGLTLNEQQIPPNQDKIILKEKKTKKKYTHKFKFISKRHNK